MTLTIQQYADVLKTQYPQRRITELFYKRSPLLALIPKVDDFEGEDMRITVEVAPTTGGSATFSDAQSNIGPTTHRGFVLTVKKDYSLYRIETHVRRASRSKKGAVVKATDTQMDAALNVISTSMSAAAYRNGGGSRAVIESVAGNDLFITQAIDARLFERNMFVQVSTDDGNPNAPQAGVVGAAVQVTTVSRRARRLTAAAPWPAEYQPGRFLFRRGDYGLMMQGLDGYLPATAPQPGDPNFLNVDRSEDVERLAGQRYVATVADDGTMARALNNAIAELRVFGPGGSQNPDVIMMNSLDRAILANELDTKTSYGKLEARMSPDTARFSFETMVLTTDEGDVNVLGDPYCPRGIGYALELKTWKLHHLGPCPGFIDEDGEGMFLRVGDADAIEARIGSYHELECNAPGRNMRIDYSDITNAAA